MCLLVGLYSSLFMHQSFYILFPFHPPITHHLPVPQSSPPPIIPPIIFIIPPPLAISPPITEPIMEPILFVTAAPPPPHDAQQLHVGAAAGAGPQ